MGEILKTLYPKLMLLILPLAQEHWTAAATAASSSSSYYRVQVRY